MLSLIALVGVAGALQQPTGDTSRVKADAEAVNASLRPAISLIESGRWSDAERTLRDCIAKTPTSARAHFILGYVLFREIQAKAIEQAAAGRVKDVTEDKQLVTFKVDHARASLDQFTEGSRYQTPTADDLKIVALDYVLLDDFMDADKWFSRAVKWNPGDADGWYNLGRTKYSENRFEEAINALQHCLALEPHNIKAEDNLGLAYAGLGRAKDAITAYQAAISWQEKSAVKDAGPYVNLGDLLLDENRTQEAIVYLGHGVAIAPNYSKAHAHLGKAYLRLGQLANAQSELETAVALTPGNAPFHYLLAQVYRKEGMNDKAKVEFDRTSALNGTHSSDKTSRQ